MIEKYGEFVACPKCGRDATKRVIKRQGHCSRCQEKVEAALDLRDTFAKIIVAADMKHAGIEEVKDPEKYAETVWAIAAALARWGKR